jgi:enoyl-CoA hydratase/carnithine racemase
LGAVTPQFESVAVDIDDRVATVTLDRPDRLNAFTSTMRDELLASFDMLDRDDDVRVVIVTGAGKAFCAGADLDGQGTVPSEEIAGVPRDGGGMVALRIAAMKKPVIGAINGAAVGVGATMTLPMDVRVAAESARFGFVFVRRGIVPEAASSWFLPRVVGISQATEWALTGRVFGADEALRGRLVSAVVPDGQVVVRAREIAAEIVDTTSAVSVAATRQMLWAMQSESSPWTAHLTETLVIRELRTGGDPEEGRRSFLERRSPVFPMRVSSAYPASGPSWPRRPDGLADGVGSLAEPGSSPES